VDGLECDEELRLGDVVDMSFDERLNFFAVRAFQHAKTTNIERLGKV